MSDTVIIAEIIEIAMIMLLEKGPFLYILF